MLQLDGPRGFDLPDLAALQERLTHGVLLPFLLHIGTVVNGAVLLTSPHVLVWAWVPRGWCNSHRDVLLVRDRHLCHLLHHPLDLGAQLPILGH